MSAVAEALPEVKEARTFHWARIENSPRLRKLRDALMAAGEKGLTTFEIVLQAHCIPNSAVPELRRNGFTISCVNEGSSAEKDTKIFRYRLTSWTADAYLGP